MTEIRRKKSQSFWWFYHCKSKKLVPFNRMRRLVPPRQRNGVSAKGERELREREEVVIKGGEECCFVLQRSVKRLHFGDSQEKEMAAREIKRLAREDLKTRKSLASLGVIPSLVTMLGSDVPSHRESALQALMELANGTYSNKALMVESGILTKLPLLVHLPDPLRKQDFAFLLLSLSSLASTQFPISPAEILPFLVEILDSDVTNTETKAVCLATLYNFSTILDHAAKLASCGTVHMLLKLSTEKETSERALATLGNLAVTVAGRKAIEDDPMVPKCFIGTLAWEDKARCQELATYILMILAHRSAAQRSKMAGLGVVPILLEVALLSSPLAQKRALRILQWFKNDRQMKVGAHSGPQMGRLLTGSPMNDNEVKEGRNAIKKMVKQSLDKNMDLITRRANATGDATKQKGLVVSSSSKSLPY